MDQKILVLGSLNTDIIASGVDRILGKGELTMSGELKIGPGGKSRNIAQMIAALQKNPTVSMLSVTSRDPFGLWKVPFDALEMSRVDTSHIKIFDFAETNKFPGVALIPVEKDGNNQIYVLPGISGEFAPKIIDENEELFRSAKIIVFTLEMPQETIIHALRLAKKYSLKVMFDPGGIGDGFDKNILESEIEFIKPNEYEAKILTGIDVIDFESAKLASEILFNKGIRSIMITHGAKGAYYFDKNFSKHIKAPEVNVNKEIKDSTGCGDQTMAAFIVGLLTMDDPLEIAEFAVKCGVMQYYRSGIDPVLFDEV